MKLRKHYLLWLLLLSGCGWHLQGAYRVPEQLAPLYLAFDDTHSEFARALTRRLRSMAVPITEDRSQARTILTVSRDAGTRQVTAVSALNQPQQYQLNYNVEYRLDQPQLDQAGASAKNLVPPQQISSSRIMSYDRTLELAKQREETILYQSMAEELAGQVLRRLSNAPRS